MPAVTVDKGGEIKAEAGTAIALPATALSDVGRDRFNNSKAAIPATTTIVNATPVVDEASSFHACIIKGWTIALLVKAAVMMTMAVLVESQGGVRMVMTTPSDGQQDLEESAAMPAVTVTSTRVKVTIALLEMVETELEEEVRGKLSPPRGVGRRRLVHHARMKAMIPVRQTPPPTTTTTSRPAEDTLRRDEVMTAVEVVVVIRAVVVAKIIRMKATRELQGGEIEPDYGI